ncbi:Zn(II)2Cys6 transcription factor [Aspergillus stella-maris]|uniref:Zn(II)2Cys6 transcription factor n=1 Tax=Aspergillus stella-maris TaxID=1810926 RepID=UPI003CCE1853
MFSQQGRRASRACVSCHQRKLRCDASFRGCPCTRCLQDGKETCILREKLPRFSRSFYNNRQSNTSNPTERQVEQDNENRSRGATPAGTVEFSHYPFLEINNAQALDKEDVAYMRSKGCFSVPDQPVLDDFVNQYFLHIHPETPVLDEAGFWRLYKGDETRSTDSDGKLSLFVFQALIFRAVSYVSQETVLRCGFADKETARATFYKRAKLLFDLRAESSPLNKAQGAVLLSHQVSPDDPQTGSLWLVYATQNTVILGQQPSILLRDRCLCLGLRRRTQLTSKHFNAETSYFEETDFADEIAHSQVYDSDSKRILFEALQHQCRLAVVVSDMASFMFTSNGVSSPSLSFEGFQSHRCEIKRLRNELLYWERRFSPPQMLPNGNVLPSPIMTFIKVTYMYYYAAQSNLSHYEALIVESHSDFAGKSYTVHLSECASSLKDTVAGLTKTMEYFSDARNVENVPLSTLAYVATPLVNAAFDVKLARSYEEMVVRRRHVDLLADIYRRLALLYNVTNYVAVGTNQILKLVYRLSQELLLREHSSHTTVVAGSQFSRSASNLRALKPSCKSRLTDWVDVFIHYPRAYLLISTSVDYSLSIGRLPHDNDIPEFIRDGSPGTSSVKLPWMTETALVNPSDATEPDFWCPSYCAPARPLSVIRPQNESSSLHTAAGMQLTIGISKPPFQLQPMADPLWPGVSGTVNAQDHLAMPVTFDQGPINLDFFNAISPTGVPFFQPASSQVMEYGQPGAPSGIATPFLTDDFGGSGGLRQVYMRDDDTSAYHFSLFDYYNEMAGNGPSMLCPLTYPSYEPPHDAHDPSDDQTDSNDGLS